MFYQIQINLARKGAEPIWEDLLDDNGNSFAISTVKEARTILRQEERGPNARIIRWDAAAAAALFGSG